MSYIAAIREGRALVFITEAGAWIPASLIKLGNVKVRRFHNPASAIEVADMFAKRLGCGWRVEMVS